MRHRCAALGTLLPLLLLSGCGGGGSSSSGGTPGNPYAASVTLRASAATITPGQSVTLTWTSKNASSVQSSNMGVQDVSGSLTVAPTFSSDYAITVSGDGTASAKVHVAVQRPRPRFLVVGSASDPEVPQIESDLQAVGTVTLSSTIPASSGSYDALVLHTSYGPGPLDEDYVKAALSANKGVVLVGLAPSKLATGISAFTNNGSSTDQTLDTTGIAAWFGGVTEIERGVGGDFHAPYAANVDLPYFALPPSVNPSQSAYASGGGDDDRLPSVDGGRIGASAYKVLTSSGFFSNASAIAFAYKFPSGGRVYWQWHSSGFDAASQASVAGIFTTGCLWAASE